jgi:hypothetical protein
MLNGSTRDKLSPENTKQSKSLDLKALLESFERRVVYIVSPIRNTCKTESRFRKIEKTF